MTALVASELDLHMHIKCTLRNYVYLTHVCMCILSKCCAAIEIVSCLVLVSFWSVFCWVVCIVVLASMNACYHGNCTK